MVDKDLAEEAVMRMGVVVAVTIAVALPSASPAMADVILHREPDAAVGGRGGVRVADMNRDGHDDVVSASILTIALGNGAGQFATSYSFPSGQGISPQTADFDGDGDLDLAWTRDGYLYMTPGDGAGHVNNASTWAPPAANPHTGFDFAGYLTSVDFNGDGRSDLAVAYQGPGYPGGVKVFLGQPGGTMTESYAYTLPGSTDAKLVDWGDIDHDRVLDLLIGTDDRGLLVAKGRANGTFDDPADTDTGDVVALYTDDFDDDGFIDDVVYAKAPGALILRHGAAGGLESGHGVGTVAAPEFRFDMTSGDFDSDGRLDAVLLAPDRALGVLFGNGQDFEPLASLPLRNPTDALAVGDFNEDGADDLFLAERFGAGYVMRNSPAIALAGETADFGDVLVGAPAASRAISIANTGAAPLTIGDLRVEGPAFSLLSNTCGPALLAGGTCHAVAGFSPAAAGALTGRLAITSNDPNGQATVTLTARGLMPAPPKPATPRPTTPGNAAEAAAKALTRALAKLGLARLGRARSVNVTFESPAAGTLTLSLRGSRRQRLAGASFKLSGPGKRAVKLRLSARTRRTLSRARSLKVTAKSTFTPRKGATITGQSKVTLKRAA